MSPFDQAAGVPGRRLTPAAEQLATPAGDRRERGAALLAAMAAIGLSGAAVQRATRDVGRRPAGRPRQGFTFGPGVARDGRRDAAGRAVASFTGAATGTRPRGPGAGVYHPPPPDGRRAGRPPPPVQARYLSGLYGLARMGPLLRRRAAPVGLGRAAVWVALTDGGNGPEAVAQADVNRPDRVVILDFYDAASYLEKLAQSVYDELAFDRLPVLADALEDAGGDDAAILAHCRGPGPHVRGCWVVDLLLGKS